MSTPRLLAEFELLEKQAREYVFNTGFGLDAGGANEKIVALDPAPPDYKVGMSLAFKNRLENTGAVTINVNGLGPKHVRKTNGLLLIASELQADMMYEVRYNGIDFVLMGDGGGSGGGSDLSTDAIGHLENKVDKVTGKGLSTNDYTAGDKAKVDALDLSNPEQGYIATYDAATQKLKWAAPPASNPTSAVESVNSKTGKVELTASDVGAAATTHGHAISDVTDLTTTLSGKVSTTSIGKINGVAALNELGQVVDAAGNAIVAGSSGTLSSLTDLEDVDTVTTPPSEGYILKYIAGVWKPVADTTGGTSGSTSSFDGGTFTSPTTAHFDGGGF